MVVEQAKLCSRKNPIVKTQATPPVGYGTILAAAVQNVRGMAELLKHQAVLQLRQENAIDVLFRTETHAKSYYSFHSEGHMCVVNGNTKDKLAGFTAVIAPHIIPHVKNIVQHTSRILQITIDARSKGIRFIGVYSPRDKTEAELRRVTFWEKLSEVVAHILLSPEHFFIIRPLMYAFREDLSTNIIL